MAEAIKKRILNSNPRKRTSIGRSGHSTNKHLRNRRKTYRGQGWAK